MKTLSYTAATILVVAGSAFAAKETEVSVLAPVPGFTGPIDGERAGNGLFVLPTQNVPSWDGQGSPNNAVVFFNIGAGNAVNGIGWDVVLTAFGASWRSEIAILVTDSANLPFTGFTLRPGAANTSPGGPTAYSSQGILKLANYNIPPVVALADGLIRVEFFETYDDGVNQQDGVWNSGTIAFQLRDVPAPGAAGLLGLAGVGLLGRKRR